MQPDFKKMVRKMGHRKAAKMGITPEMVQGKIEETQSWEGNGGCFRGFMYLGFLVIFFLLLFMNVDREYAAGGYLEKMHLEGAKGAAPLSEELLSTLDIKTEEGRPIDMAEVQEKYKAKREELSNKKDCPECAQQLVLLDQSQSQLSTHVDINCFEVLGAQPKATASQLRKKRDERLKDCKEDGTCIAKVNQAYEILVRPLSRQYFDMYGVALPEWGKHQRESTHGGWGVEFGTDKWRTVMLKGIIDYFNDIRLEIALGVLALSVIAYKAFSSRKMLTDLTEQYFENEEMAAEAKEEDEKLRKEEEEREEARLKKKEEKAAKQAKRRH